MGHGRLYSELETCEQPGICRKTLKDHVRAGDIRYVLIGKRTRKYKPRDLEDFIDKQTRQMAPPDDRSRSGARPFSEVIGLEEALRRRRKGKPRSKKGR